MITKLLKRTPAPPQRFINLTRPHAVLLTDEDLNSPKNEIDRDLNNNCQECRNGPQSEQQLNTHVPTTEQQLNVQQAYDLEVSNLTLSFVRNLRIVEEEKQNLLVDLTAMRERCANLEDSKESSKRKLTSASLDKEQGTGAIKNYRPRPNTKSNMLQAKRPLPQMCGPPPLMSTKKLSTTGGAIVKAKVPVPIAIRPKVLKKNTGNSRQSECTSTRGVKRKMEGEKSVTANPPTKRINMLKATETMGEFTAYPIIKADQHIILKRK
ncbi:unnamed protein product [Mytilus edulis]|uniref:Uncharacterized protein n=1 Tax=Mytilus edulis TaxID=6550 RepID=A0A8S3UEH5_MYTED|nr:unnamed protein product [Mytilus edulis]